VGEFTGPIPHHSMQWPPRDQQIDEVAFEGIGGPAQRVQADPVPGSDCSSRVTAPAVVPIRAASAAALMPSASRIARTQPWGGRGKPLSCCHSSKCPSSSLRLRTDTSLETLGTRPPPS
jgi:hypothetical protein